MTVRSRTSVSLSGGDHGSRRIVKGGGLAAEEKGGRGGGEGGELQCDTPSGELVWY